MVARYWVGGGGNFNDTAHWSQNPPASQNPPQSVPSTGDNVIIDNHANGLNNGVLIVNQNIAVQNINASTMLGTFDNSGNFNVTCTGTAGVWYNWSGTTTRTIIGGSGTYRAVGNAPGLALWALGTITGLANAPDCFQSATIELEGTSATIPAGFTGGTGMKYGQVRLIPSTVGYAISTTACEITTLTAAAPNVIFFGPALTFTISNMALVGTVADPILVLGGTSSQAGATISTAGALTLSGCVLRGITKSGTGSIIATNTLDLGINSITSLTEPTGGGGGVIGG